MQYIKVNLVSKSSDLPIPRMQSSCVGLQSAQRLTIQKRFLTVHVTSYLQKSDDFRGNLLWLSLKICVEICGSSVVSLQNRLSGMHRIVFQAPVESSF